MPVTTIDQLDLDAHDRYARLQEAVEEINRQYGLDQATAIAPQVQTVDFLPKPSEMDLLFGASVVSSFAHFREPKAFRERRRSPFTVACVMPSLGSVADQEDLETHIASVKCETPEEERQKAAILACFAQRGKLNDWLEHIYGRIGQFLLG